MSILHTILFHQIKKTKSIYSSSTEKNYVQSRNYEDARMDKLPIPFGVQIEQAYLGTVPVEYVMKKSNSTDTIVLYIHGGGFVEGSAKARRSFTTYIANKMNYNVAAINYRLAPEYPFPKAPLDCVEAYQSLLLKYHAEKIILLGESAGGNLVLSTLLYIKNKKLPYPAASFVISPTVQYDQELDSYEDNSDSDCMITNLSEEICDTYLQSTEESVVKSPYAAPYYGDFTGCSPVYIWSSASEVLRDDSVIMADKLKAENVKCELFLREKMMHAYLIVPAIKESKKDLKTIKKYMDDAVETK